MLVESLSGVRGHFKDGLDENLVKAYAAAFARWTHHGKIILGRDSRASGVQIQAWMESTFKNLGCEVVRIGVVPTPTVQLMVELLNADGGVAITASHNPLPWNGLKFISSEGIFLDKGEISQLIEMKTEAAAIISEYKGSPETTEQDDSAPEKHIRKIWQIPYVNPDLIRARKYRVVFDAVNGAGSRIIPELLNSLGCETILINCNADLPFPRNPEPLPENLTEICEKVRETEADIGFVVDPDADRLAVVSNHGNPVSEEYTLVLASSLVLRKVPGNHVKVVTNLSTTMAMDDVCQRYDAELHRTAIGEINVAKEMKRINAVIGGEGNGGVILPEAHYGRDSLVGIILILQLMAEENHSISHIVSEFPHYSICKKKINLPPERMEKVLQMLVQSSVGENMDLRDGVKIIFGNSWVHLRKSNTEPIMRVYTEAPTRAEAEMLADRYIQKIQGLE